MSQQVADHYRKQPNITSRPRMITKKRQNTMKSAIMRKRRYAHLAHAHHLHIAHHSAEATKSHLEHHGKK
ncbi:MAG: hypothetical protein M3Z35_14100 [Nitrospirota bacterium]|nr:hypothetical protein [Nitrospirota bacterium]